MFRKKSKQRKQSIVECAASEQTDGDPTPRLSGELGYFTVPLLEDMLWELLASYGDTSFELDLMRWGQLLTKVSSPPSSRRDSSRSR